MVTACPSFLADADLHRWTATFEDEDTPDLFVRTSALALHLVELLREGRLEEVTPAATVVEGLLDDGDDATRELATLGLLEALGNITSHDDVGVGPGRVRAVLGPSAMQAWHGLDAMWSAAAALAAATSGPRVTVEDYAAISDPDLRRFFQVHRRAFPGGVIVGEADVLRAQTEQVRVSVVGGPADGGIRSGMPWAAVLSGLALALAVAVVLLVLR